MVSAWATEARHRSAPGTRLLYATLTAEFIDRWQPVYDRLNVFLAEGVPVFTPPGEVAARFQLDDELDGRANRRGRRDLRERRRACSAYRAGGFC